VPSVDTDDLPENADDRGADNNQAEGGDDDDGLERVFGKDLIRGLAANVIPGHRATPLFKERSRNYRCVLDRGLTWARRSSTFRLPGPSAAGPAKYIAAKGQLI